jgi:hypothetical protein
MKIWHKIHKYLQRFLTCISKNIFLFVNENVDIVSSILIHNIHVLGFLNLLFAFAFMLFDSWVVMVSFHIYNKHCIMTCGGFVLLMIKNDFILFFWCHDTFLTKEIIIILKNLIFFETIYIFPSFTIILWYD